MKSLRNPLISFVLFSIVGLVFEFSLNAYFQMLILYVLINALMGMSLNLVNGYTGQFSLGHAGFMAIGAYFSAWASTHFQVFPESLNFFNFFVYSIFSGLLAAFAGYLVGQPSLRLRGDYLAIVTLGFGEIIRVVLLNLDFLGGPRGLSGITPFPEINFMGANIGRFYSTYVFASFWFLLCFFFIWRLIRSTHGRTFLAVREDEIAAQSLGVNTTRAKVMAFVFSSFFAGVAGSLFAHIATYINPSTFSFLKSIDSVIIVVLGGMGSISGSITAAIIVTLMPELLRSLQDLFGVDLRMIIYSLMLILIMLLRPKGIFGESELPDLWRKYVRKSS